MSNLASRYALSLGVAVLLTTGCNSMREPIAAPGALPQSPSSQARLARRASWMLPEAKSSDLLYVTDGDSDLDVLAYPGYKVVGRLSGFAELIGVCTDKSGNVWVPDSARSTVIEYAHGSTTPIATLYDPNTYMIACAVDALSGDLAVYTLAIAGGSPNIAIFAHAGGTPISFSVPSLTLLNFISYGPRSQLFLDGTTSGGAFEMQRFYRGSFSRLRIQGAKITSTAGGVQYAEGALTVNVAESGNASLIYRMNESGLIEGTTQLLDSYSCQGYLIWKKDLICPSGFEDLRVYAYPQGGSYKTRVPLQYFGSQVAMSVATPQ